MKKKHLIGYFLLFLMCAFVAVLFMTPAVTDTCSDEIFACLEKVNTLPLWERVKTGMYCFFNNLICVFGNAGNLF